MSKHLIRTDLLPEFKKSISSIGRKCLKNGIPFVYEELGSQFRDITPNGVRSFVEFTEVEVDLKIIYNDWDVIIQISKSESGNNLITYCNVTYDSKYDKYIENEICCEHCHQNRKRNTAYVLKNRITEETIIVGSSCLEEFTGGLDASVTAKCFEALNNVIEFEKLSNDMNTVYCSSIFYPLEYILNIASAIVEKEKINMVNHNTGFLSSKVKDYLNNLYSLDAESINAIRDKSNEYFSWINEFINSREDVDSFLRDLKTVCNNGKVCWKEIGYICSIIKIYQDNHKNGIRLINEYYGELKQKVTINVIDVKSHSFDSVYGVCYIHVFISDEGYTFTWKTSKSIQKRESIVTSENETKDIVIIPSKIKGTIKSFNDYNGTRQTVLTRCEILSTIMKDCY